LTSLFASVYHFPAQCASKVMKNAALMLTSPEDYSFSDGQHRLFYVFGSMEGGGAQKISFLSKTRRIIGDLWH
ncbi:hypothetical protein, partial [uncultured Oscillibacter sp.]|uniref:hypothetical protein n=1 Tax=uncultured Oscillibacter sp. TaxID=876091 RepID=UPI00262C5170